MLSLPYGDETNVTLNEHSFISFDERDGFVQMGFRDTDGVILGAKDGKTSNGKNTYIPFNKIIPVSDLVGICDTNSQFSLCYTGYTKGELSTPLITYTTTGTEINFYQDDSSDPFATISASEDETIELLDYTFDDSANLYILVWIGGENAYKVYKYTNTKEGYKVANEETDIYSFNDEFEPQCLAYDPYKQKLYAYTEGTSGETNTPILYYDVFTMNQLENNDSGLKILYDDTVIEKRTWRVVWVKGQPCLVVNAVSNKTENNTRTTSLVIKGKQAENGTPLDEATDYSQQSIHLESLNISWEKLTLEDVVSVGDAVYILCSANDSDNSSRKFSAGGFVIKLNADSNSFTIDESFGNDGFLGWQERDPATPNGTIIINYQSASPSYSYQWLMFGPTEENPQNVFIGPRKIVAIKPNELFIADAAFFMAGTANSDSDWKKERKSRIVKISKNGKSFGVTKTLDQDKEYFITE